VLFLMTSWRITEKLWKGAMNFSCNTNLNRKFLLGQIPTTSYHCGPIYEETMLLIPCSIEYYTILDYLLLTTSSVNMTFMGRVKSGININSDHILVLSCRIRMANS
jgi:hypothetical protein